MPGHLRLGVAVVLAAKAVETALSVQLFRIKSVAVVLAAKAVETSPLS